MYCLDRGDPVKLYLLVQCLRSPIGQKSPSVLKAAADELEAVDLGKKGNPHRLDTDEIWLRLRTGADYDLEYPDIKAELAGAEGKQLGTPSEQTREIIAERILKSPETVKRYLAWCRRSKDWS
jgi:hypothetical protein